MHHDVSAVDEILSRYPREESSLVMVLQDVQAHFRYLPCEALERVALVLGVPTSRVFSVATFYKVLTLQPQGRTIVEVCKGTACHVRGAQLVEDEIGRQLGIVAGQTTADGKFTLRTVNCVGACAMAPVVVVEEHCFGEVTPAQVGKIVRKAESMADQAPEQERAHHDEQLSRIASPADLLALAQEAAQAFGAIGAHVQVCGGRGCLAGGSLQVFSAIQQAAQAAGLQLRTELAQCGHQPLLTLTGCRGLCQRGPLVGVMPAGVLYGHVKAGDADEIVQSIANGTVAERLVCDRKGTAEPSFYDGQDLRSLATCGVVDPESLYDHLAQGGFLALAKAVTEMTPAQVLDAVEQSGLRGRGGAGFPTARKWRSALAASVQTGYPPYVLCNGDEGDPGAFMNRSVMEGAPFQLIEGMILGAYALGARRGYIYVRNEYPLAVARLGHAIEVCRKTGLLGDNILGTHLSFDLSISRGGGAFVCGESTALMRSIEGRVGEPRAKYVRSAERGLHDRPTVLNNVETWTLIPGIVRHGPQWLSSVGTSGSKGTKVFALVGQVQRTGLVEVPMGTSLRQLVFGIGGGVFPGRTFKAVQTGGPSGGCLPESMLDLPIDFDALTEAGSMMGSGGLIVLDDRTCMVDMARYFVDFLLQESCGKCSPCRLGLPQLVALLERVCRGEAVEADLAKIQDICEGMVESSLCGLGKSAPNPVLSTLRYFRDEYLEHLHKRCPAGVCRSLIRYCITDKCTGCKACVKPCPASAISGELKKVHKLDPNKCTKCGVCRSVCKFDAIQVRSAGGVA